jgi:RNA polymerase sigma factor (TIGR02999 family)
MSKKNNVTELLNQWAQGEDQALHRLFMQASVHQELKRKARKHMWGERDRHLLQPTELINEAFLRLNAQRDKKWESRGQFFGWMSNLMRNYLIDRARHRDAAKRGLGAVPQSLEFIQEEMGEEVSESDNGISLFQLTQTFEQLKKLDEQQYAIVQLRITGSTVVETAEALNISEATVKRDYSTACAWIYREMGVYAK